MKIGKGKKVVGDFVYTFTALVIMNVVLQLVVYPLVNRKYGADFLGNIVYYTGLIYIAAASIGNACSNSRLICRKNLQVTNGDFNIIVSASSVLVALVYIGVFLLNEGMSAKGLMEAILYGMAAVCIFLRYYSEVEFRLNLKFKGYLIYYLIISAGYLLGYLLFLLTRQWALIFIVGEGLGVAYVFLKGGIYKRQDQSADFKKALSQVGTLACSYILIFIASQYYKFFIKQFFGAYEVTQYYVASFFGKSLDMVITPISTLIMSYLTRSNEKQSGKQFLKIVMLVSGIGVVLYIGFIIATPIYTHLFYNNMVADVKEINLIVNLAQSISAVASILSVFVLAQLGTKVHFRIQLVYVLCYVGLTTALSMTPLGITGFAIGATVAFSVRFLVTAVIGYKKMK